jgi:hypothetical protein
MSTLFSQPSKTSSEMIVLRFMLKLNQVNKGEVLFLMGKFFRCMVGSLIILSKRV